MKSSLKLTDGKTKTYKGGCQKKLLAKHFCYEHPSKKYFGLCNSGWNQSYQCRDGNMKDVGRGDEISLIKPNYFKID